MAGALLGTIGLLFRVSEVFRPTIIAVVVVLGVLFGSLPGLLGGVTLLVVAGALLGTIGLLFMVRGVRGDASAMVRVVVGELF